MRFVFLKVSSLLASLLLVEAAHGAPTDLYRVGQSPYSAYIAQKVGDILTVDIDESAETSDNGKRSLKKNSSNKMELKNLFLPKLHPQSGMPAGGGGGGGSTPGVEFGIDRSYQADAANTSSHRVGTKLQVRIIEIIRPGEFVVRGIKEVLIDNKVKKIFLSGIVRQRDIESDNTVKSYKVADARIEIEGDVNSKDLKPGIINRLFDWMF